MLAFLIYFDGRAFRFCPAVVVRQPRAVSNITIFNPMDGALLFCSFDCAWARLYVVHALHSKARPLVIATIIGLPRLSVAHSSQCDWKENVSLWTHAEAVPDDPRVLAISPPPITSAATMSSHHEAQRARC